MEQTISFLIMLVEDKIFVYNSNFVKLHFVWRVYVCIFVYVTRLFIHGCLTFFYPGFYGSERSERSLIDYPVKDEEADEDTKFKEELSRWRRTDTG